MTKRVQTRISLNRIICHASWPIVSRRLTGRDGRILYRDRDLVRR